MSASEPSDLLEQYIALHEDGGSPAIVARVAKARALLNEIDAQRARSFIEQLLQDTSGAMQ